MMLSSTRQVLLLTSTIAFMLGAGMREEGRNALGSDRVVTGFTSPLPMTLRRENIDRAVVP